MSGSELFEGSEALRRFCAPLRLANVGEELTIQLPDRRIKVRVIATEQVTPAELREWMYIDGTWSWQDPELWPVQRPEGDSHG